MDSRTSPVSNSRTPHQVGRLTAMMRAAKMPELPRVLRVGMVSDGKVTQERACDSFPVTIGGDEGASMIVPGMRGRHSLFVSQGGGVTLCLLPGMSGRMVSEEGAVDLASAVSHAARTGLAARLPVSTHARGRIDFEGARILFQFAERPMPGATPRLPLAVKSGTGIDWTLAMICAMSFLLHFGFLGAMYSDWADPIVKDDFTVGVLVDMQQRLAQPQTVETPDEQAKPVAPSDRRAETAKPAANATASSHGATSTNASPTSPSTQKGDASLLASRADGMMMGIITAQSESAPSTELALRRSEIPAIDLGRADGNLQPTSELTFHSQAPVAPGQSHDLTTLGVVRATAQTTAGQQRDVAVPFTMDLPPAISTVRVTNADRTIAELRPKFRKCYTDGLAKDSSQQGALVIRAKIAPTGEVASVVVTSNTGLSAEVAACVSRRVQNAQFDAPGGTGSTLDIPVKFLHQ